MMGRNAKIKAARKQLHKDLDFQKEVMKRSRKVVQAGMNESIKDFVNDNCYAILAALYTEFGWGPVRLERFMDRYEEMINKMKAFYETNVDDLPSPCREIVLRSGFDIKKWEEKHNA